MQIDRRSPGAEQATKSRKRGSRGTGRRFRRRIADAEARREQALRDLDVPFWRAWVLARIDKEIAQLRWELKLRWTGEPLCGPRVECQPPPGRPGVPPREVIVLAGLSQPESNPPSRR